MGAPKKTKAKAPKVPKYSPEARAILDALEKTGGHQGNAAAVYGCSRTSFYTKINKQRAIHGSDFGTQFGRHNGGAPGLPDEDLLEAWAIYERHAYNATTASEAVGMSLNTFKHRIVVAKSRLGLVEEKDAHGRINEGAAARLPLPRPGKVKRYILTCIQNNTKLHEPTWRALMALKEYWGAELKISTYTYRAAAHNASTKRNKEKAEDEIWYAPEAEPYLCDEYQELAKGLTWCGHMNTLPTAQRPLTGFESYGGRNSGIFPHPKFAMESIASHKSEPAKLQYTTGTATLRNYIQKRAGIRAEFHHCYGALVAEVDDQGHWWVRQLNTDKQGRIFDLDIFVDSDGVVKPAPSPKAIVFGDIHAVKLDPTVDRITWGPGGMVETLKPEHQIVHDVLDFQARSHHTRKDPHERYRLWVKGQESVYEEIRGCANFLNRISRQSSKIAVVESNHHEHLQRWLRETDWRDDMANAEFYIDAQRAMLKSIRESQSFNAFAWTLKEIGLAKNIRMLGRDESFILCPDASGGIECGMHGDQGPNGSRGSAANISRMGRKACIGHSHSACIRDGVYQTGYAAEQDMGYNVGPSSWSWSDIVIYANGKRAIITKYANKWRADGAKTISIKTKKAA